MRNFYSKNVVGIWGGYIVGSAPYYNNIFTIKIRQRVNPIFQQYFHNKNSSKKKIILTLSLLSAKETTPYFNNIFTNTSLCLAAIRRGFHLKREEGGKKRERERRGGKKERQKGEGARRRKRKETG